MSRSFATDTYLIEVLLTKGHAGAAFLRDRRSRYGILMSEQSRPPRGRSTSNEAVYALPKADPSYTKLLATKWERINAIKEFLNDANDSEKHSFAKHYLHLRNALHTYLQCSERLFILFDSSTIQDIVARHCNVKRRVRFNSLLALLVLAEDYCLSDVFSGITPGVLYELNGKRAIQNSKEAGDIIERTSGHMADIGLQVSYLGFSNLPQLFAAHRYIESDEQAIITALRQINQIDWTIDISSMPDGMRSLPLAIAEKKVPDITLKYFSAWYVKYILMMIMERKIYEVSKHHRRFRMFASPHRDTGLASIVKVKNTKVNGLADIEILSLCDLAFQAVSGSPQITMAVSFDENLNKALRSRMRIHEPRLGLEGGSDPKQGASAFTYAAWRWSRKNRKCDERSKEFDAAAADFWHRHLKERLGCENDVLQRLMA